MNDGEVVVEIENLERRFGDLRAVDGLSFSFRSGDIHGFVGPNGAGKTTTMRILATVDVPDGGDARINGVSVVDDPDRLRPLIGYMPDHLPTYTHMTVGEYLDFFARAYGLRGRRRRETVRSVMEFTDLGPLGSKSCETLSKGMVQRLGLGRMLIQDPKVLILDEPAAGLDPRARVEFRELVAELSRRGNAILISSHILTELAEICNRVTIIERGRLMAGGSIEEIGKGLRPASAIRIRLVDRAEEARRFLTAYPLVSAVRTVGDRLEADYRGDEAGMAGLLKALVEAGFSVSEFAPKERSLEDIFMQVTKGEVA